MSLATSARQLDEGPGLPLPQVRGHDLALDGLRGLAIWLVLFHHLTPCLAGGSNALDAAIARVVAQLWIGVDLFFVLSGFLITGILLDARGRPHYFRNFYARRVLRIFPLYYLLIAFYFVVAPHLPGVRLDTARAYSPLFYLTFTTNVPFALASPSARPLFLVSWSLCIEEQFYLVWPLIVLFSRDRTVVRWAIGAVAVSIASRAICRGAGLGWQAGYMLTPCRLDGLAVGAMVAVLVRDRVARWWNRRHLAAAIAVIGAGCLALLATSTQEDQTVAGGLILSTGLALFTGLLIAAIVTHPPGGWLRQVLENRALVVAGRLSYGLYLLHGIVARFVDRFVTVHPLPTLHGSHLPEQLLYWSLALSGAWAAAIASRVLIEQPALSLKRYFPSGHAPVRPTPAAEADPPY